VVFVVCAGIGLSISSRLVQLMKGRMVVASQQGVGSTFQFDVRCGLTNAKDNDRPPAPRGELKVSLESSLALWNGLGLSYQNGLRKVRKLRRRRSIE
jgi:hypothetical protein